jgi:hypothetical protein
MYVTAFKNGRIVWPIVSSDEGNQIVGYYICCCSRNQPRKTNAAHLLNTQKEGQPYSKAVQLKDDAASAFHHSSEAQSV